MNTTTNTTTVSRENLDVLANLALAAINVECDQKLAPEFNLEQYGASAALTEALKERYHFDIGSPRINAIISGVEVGFEAGLGIAAAVVTHGLDLSALRDAVKVELKRIDTSALPGVLDSSSDSERAA